MANLRKYRMNDLNFFWVDEYMKSMGTQAYCEYEKKVNDALDNLTPGHYYNIERDVPEEKLDLFIKLCCSYILQNSGYVMSEDYTKIERLKEE